MDLNDALIKVMKDWKKDRKKLIAEFLEDWNRIRAVTLGESAYIYHSITEEEHKSIKEKWEEKRHDKF